jgi:hypothetical protein
MRRIFLQNFLRLQTVQLGSLRLYVPGIHAAVLVMSIVVMSVAEVCDF